MKTLLPILVASLPLAAQAVVTPVEDIAHCATISADADRLACYDTLARRLASNPPPKAPLAASAPQAAQAPVARSAPAAPAAQTAETFGLTPAQQHIEYSGPTSIQAHITKLTPDVATGSAMAILDNAQSWKIANDDGALRVGDLVTIKRAALGSFMLWSPSNHSYHARRLR